MIFMSVDLPLPLGPHNGGHFARVDLDVDRAAPPLPISHLVNFGDPLDGDNRDYAAGCAAAIAVAFGSGGKAFARQRLMGRGVSSVDGVDGVAAGAAHRGCSGCSGCSGHGLCRFAGGGGAGGVSVSGVHAPPVYTARQPTHN